MGLNSGPYFDKINSYGGDAGNRRMKNPGRLQNILCGIALAVLWLAFALKADAPEAEAGDRGEVCKPPPAQTAAKSLEFGSQAVLESCWTDMQLRGSVSDKKIRLTARYMKPPERERPLNTLPALAPELRYSIRAVRPAEGRKVIALTFDLCERANEITGYDAAIVNYLRSHKIKATFFAGGKWMLDHPDKTMQLMADPLFEIGNHTWSHDDLRLEKGAGMERQVLWTQAQYELLREKLTAMPCAKEVGDDELKKIPPVPYVFRFPYGVCSREALDFLARSGLPAIQWSVVTADPAEKRTPQEIAKAVLRNLKPGAIIICHANGRGHGTAESLPLFIPKLQKIGYEFVTVSELLSAGPVFKAADCYELKPGDNIDYDKIYEKQK